MERPIDHVPADLFVGLLDVAAGVGWEGPVLRIQGSDDPKHSEPVRGARGVTIDRWSPQRTVVGVYWPSIRKYIPRPIAELGLPLDRPEALFQVMRALAAGQLCPASTGHVSPPSPPSENGCPTCRGTGYVRLPAPVWHFLPQSHNERLLGERRAQEIRALVACSAWRVARGLRPVEGVEYALRLFNSRIVSLHFAGLRTWWAETEAERDHFVMPGGGHAGWAHGDARGPEVGEVAVAILHQRALAAGYAVQHPDRLDLPWPD